MSITKNNIKSKKNIIMVGEFGAGKSSLLHRFIKKEFSKGFNNTSLDFCSYELKHNDELLPVFIWDSLGHERFKSMTTSFYKKAEGAIIVFDTTEEAYKETINKWMSTLSENCSRDIPIIIVGNKRDISMAHEKKINDISLAFKGSSSVVEVISASAKNGDNVQELFHNIIIATFKSSKALPAPLSIKKEQEASMPANTACCCSIS